MTQLAELTTEQEAVIIISKALCDVVRSKLTESFFL